MGAILNVFKLTKLYFKARANILLYVNKITVKLKWMIQISLKLLLIPNF